MDFEKSVCLRFSPQQPCSEPIMSGRVAEGRLQVRQIYHLLQCVHEDDKVQTEKMVKLGVENLINLTEPQDGTGVLHVAVSTNNQGNGPLLCSVSFTLDNQTHFMPPDSLSALTLTDMVSFLLSKGAHPDVQDKRGCTAAMLAAQLGNYAIVELLSQSHANLKLKDAEGRGER